MPTVAGILQWIASNWKVILALMGIAVTGAVAGTVIYSTVQAQPAITQAIAIASYAIPMMVYIMVFQFVLQLISMIRETFSK